MIFLSLIGLAVAVGIWQSGHPVWAVVVGFLLIGGFGWKLLGAAVSVVLQPHVFTRGRTFIAAWERRMGPMMRGLPATHPPRGAYQQWRRENRRTGITAGDWLDVNLGVPGTGLHHVDVTVGDDIGVRFTKQADGNVTWRFDRQPSGMEGQALSFMAQKKLTDLQLARGDDVWFPHLLPKGEKPASPDKSMPTSDERLTLE